MPPGGRSWRADHAHPARAASFPRLRPALRAGAEVGALLCFCDLPAAATLGRVEEEDPSSPAGPSYADFTAALARTAGYDHFDAFWEAALEQEGVRRSPDEYGRILTDLGTRARSLTAARAQERDLLREAHMDAVAREVIGAGIPEERVLLVCGAAHAAAVEHLLRDGADAPPPAETETASLTLIPFGYPRFSEQSGYGAGNRAPFYHHLVWASPTSAATASGG